MQRPREVSPPVSQIQSERFSVLQRSPSPCRCRAFDYNQERQKRIQQFGEELALVYGEVLVSHPRTPTPPLRDRVRCWQCSASCSDCCGCFVLRSDDPSLNGHGNQDGLFELSDQMHFSHDALSLPGHDGQSRTPTSTPSPHRMGPVSQVSQESSATRSDNRPANVDIPDNIESESDHTDTPAITIESPRGNDGSNSPDQRVESYQDGQHIIDDEETCLFDISDTDDDDDDDEQAKEMQQPMFVIRSAPKARKSYIFQEHAVIQEQQQQAQEALISNTNEAQANVSEETQASIVLASISAPVFWDPDHFNTIQTK